MKFCPYCGADLLKEDAAFCAECGKKLSVAEEAPSPAHEADSQHNAKPSKQKTPNINIVDSFLQGVPAKQKYIFQPALRRQKPRVNKKCHLPKKQMTLIENSETTFCLRKTLILC